MNTQFANVNLRLVGTWDFWMKKIVPVHLMRSFAGLDFTNTLGSIINLLLTL